MAGVVVVKISFKIGFQPPITHPNVKQKLSPQCETKANWLVQLKETTTIALLLYIQIFKMLE